MVADESALNVGRDPELGSARPDHVLTQPLTFGNGAYGHNVNMCLAAL